MHPSTMKRFLFLVAVTLACAASILGLAGSADARSAQSLAGVAPQDLGTRGGDDSSAVAVNGDQIIVDSTLTTGEQRGFIWSNGTMHPIDPPPGFTDEFVSAVNSSGQVVGNAFNATADDPYGNATSHAFSWTSQGSVDLGTFPGGTVSHATGINDNGQIVGTSEGGLYGTDPFSIDPSSGTMTDILGRAGNWPIAVNNNGEVVGSSNTNWPYCCFHAFAWTNVGGPSGTKVDLGTLNADGGGISQATAVNSVGDVVGYSEIGNKTEGFFWDHATGTMTGLDFGGYSSYAIGVNDYGQVVGAGYNGHTNPVTGEQDQFHAFFWDRANPNLVVDLGSLAGPDGRSSQAAAVNNNGLVVGSSDDASGDTHAFSWTQAGGMKDLAPLTGDQYSYASDVNDSGMVVGTSQGSHLHAVRWETNAATAPDAPTNVAAAAGDAVAVVGWSAPSSDGGSAISQYTVTASDGQIARVPGDTLKASFYNLTDGVAYTFSVVATSASGGDSLASAPSNAVTPESGALQPVVVTARVPAEGGTVTTDPGGGPTELQPITTELRVPAGDGGEVSIRQTAIAEPSPEAFEFVGQQMEIAAPEATGDEPLMIAFRIEQSLVAEEAPSTIEIFRTEAEAPPREVADCPPGVYDPPDPCVSERAYADEDIRIVVLTASASHWNIAIPAGDSTPPTVTVPADMTREATGAGGAAVSFSASAHDAVDGDLTPTCSPASGSTFALGETTVTCSATDSHHNTGSNTFKVTVRDTTGPAVTVPADKTAEATGASGAAVTYSGQSASDLVDGSLTAACLPASGSTFALGDTTVTCSATDAHGNTGSKTFKVTVRDTTAPAVTVPADKTVTATGPGGAVVTYSGQSASDLVDGSLTPTCLPASGSTFPVGETTVTCSATDSHGNTGSKTFKITVQAATGDTTPPVLSLPSAMSVNATSPSGAAVTYTATANDAVDGSRPVSCSKASGSTFPIGDTTVNCSASDTHGNTARGSFTVHVKAASEQITDLKALVSSFTSIKKPTRDDLLSKLKAAGDELAKNHVKPACDRLRDFIQKVKDKTPAEITVTQSNQLIGAATRIRTVLACS
jgi:probable HAF family extracellular repeat protein